MKNFSNKGIHRLLFFSILILIQTSSKCRAQEAENNKEKDPPTSTITMDVYMGGAFIEYTFYDDSGSVVKKLRDDQFESRHPMHKLNALNDTVTDAFHTLERLPTAKPGTKGLQPKVIAELNSLKKLGIIVKSPERADVIIGPVSDTRPFISMPKRKYLIHIETARVLDYSAEETDGYGNALLDCSYITIYNYMGAIYKEILFPDKIIDYATVSDDGNFLMCSYSYTYLWDEGHNNVPDGVAIADLRSGKIDYISTYEPKNDFFPGSVLFADGYFQATIGSPWASICIRLYVDPYDRKYYTKLYKKDRENSRKAIFPVRSFLQFEGVLENPKQFESFSY
ncbi:MAG: hypothetical protein SH818_19815 [Saprospiraceae bacterium]|nr:hypothetical protein [Saprospiraceae bacterium]